VQSFPSCIAVYSTDPTVLNYASPGKMFGIDFFYELCSAVAPIEELPLYDVTSVSNE
jgi:hypothetical protein